MIYMITAAPSSAPKFWVSLSYIQLSQMFLHISEHDPIPHSSLMNIVNYLLNTIPLKLKGNAASLEGFLSLPLIQKSCLISWLLFVCQSPTVYSD